MYTGFRLIGVLGMFVGPILLIVFKNIFHHSVCIDLVVRPKTESLMQSVDSRRFGIAWQIADAGDLDPDDAEGDIEGPEGAVLEKVERSSLVDEAAVSPGGRKLGGMAPD